MTAKKTTLQSFADLETLKKLVSIGQSLIVIHDLTALLEMIASTAGSILKADIIVLYEYHKETGDVHIPPVIWGNLRHVEISDARGIKHRESAVFKMLRQTQAFYASNAGEDWSRLLETRHQRTRGVFIQRENIVSSAAVPLMADQECVGVLFINFRTHHTFPDRERNIIELFASQAAVAIQNARLLEREKNLRRQADTLRDVSIAINSSIGLDELAGRILDSISKVVPYRKASMQLIQGDTRTLIAYRGFGKEKIDDWLQRPISKDPLITRVIVGKKPLILNETSLDPNWEARPITTDALSWIGLPLIHGGQAIGLLMLDYNQPNFYTLPYIEDLLMSFAHQAAIAVKNATLFEDAQRRIRDLQILNENAQLISARLDTRDLLQAIAEQISKKLHCAHCSIFFPQENNGEIWLIPSVIRGSLADTYLRDYKIGEGLIGWVFQHGESIMLPDSRVEPRFIPPRVPRDTPCSMLVVPLKVGDHTIGIISADQDQYQFFDENDLRLIETLARQAGIAIQRNQGLELLKETSGSINASQSIDEILQLIVSGAIRLTNTTSGAIWLRNDGGRLSERTYKFPADSVHPGPKIDRNDSITHQVINTGEIVSIPNISADPRVNPMLQSQIHSMIALPLKHDDKVVGVLYLNNTSPHNFTETEISLLSSLTNQAATAIHKAKLYQEMKQQAGELSLLHEVSAQLMTLDLDRLLRLIVEGATLLTQTDFGIIYLLNEDGTRIVRSFGSSAQENPSRLELSEGALTRVICETGQPIYVANTHQDDRVGVDLIRGGVQSFIGHPLKVAEKVIGVLYLDNKQTREFSQGERSLIATLASQAAVAIENARIYEDLQRRVKYLDTLNRIASQFSTQPDRQQIFAEVVSEAYATLQADRCMLFTLDDQFILSLQAAKGLPQDEPAQLTFRLGESLVGWVAQIEKTVSVLDANQDPRFSPDQLSKLGLSRPAVLAPIWIEGKVAGVLSAERDGNDPFDDADLRFLETLAIQAGIFKRQEKLRVQWATAIKRRENPYIRGEPIHDPQRFFGRKTFIEDILGSIQNNSFIVYGERRIGKTSLLLQLEHHLFTNQDASYYFLPVYASLQGIPERIFFSYLMAKIVRAAAMSPEGLVTPKTKRKYGLDDFELDIGVVIRFLEQSNGKTARIVLLLDEMDVFAEEYHTSTREQFRSLFATWSGTHLKMVMAGVSVQRVQQARTSPWYNQFKEIELHPLDDGDARQLIIEPVRNFYSYEPDAVDLLLEYSDLKPYEIQRLGSFAVNCMLDKIHSEVDFAAIEAQPFDAAIQQEDISKAITLVLQEDDGKYRDLWHEFDSLQQKELLDTLNKGGSVNLKAARPDGKELFTRKDLYNVTCMKGQQAQLTRLFTQWLRGYNP